MNTFKFISIILISLLFVSCSQISMFNLVKNDNEANIVRNTNKNINIKLTHPHYQSNINFCLDTANVINDNHLLYGQLFFEEVELNEDCSWKGSALSRFEHNMMFRLKLSSLKKVEEFEIENFTFITYFLNNNTYVSMIHMYDTYRDVIILDNEGKLYEKVLKLFKPDYKNRFISKNRFDREYKNSLSSDSLFYKYIGIKND